VETLSRRQARRLALARAGLLTPRLTGMPARAAGRGRRARRAALGVVERFGYLQLDTVSIAGARSHAIVLASRLAGFDPALGEELLAPGEPLFEYWGHEASWMPLDLYPAFEFRRSAYRRHPRWGEVTRLHAAVADELRARIRDEGPLRSLDLEGGGGGGWWEHKPAKLVANALWRHGELAIRERRAFQRTYDLAERVIPGELRDRPLGLAASLDVLLLRALAGHGWAAKSTLAATWRLANLGPRIDAALGRLVERGEAVPCAMVDAEGRRHPGWVRPADLELAPALDRLRPRRDRGVLLSPFDPVLWDRRRVRLLFGFDQLLEIFKPAADRRWGYFCLPVLAGDRLVGRVDLKAHRGTGRKQGRLRVLSRHFETQDRTGNPPAADTRAVQTALERWATVLGLRLEPAG
jgi:uncharacterized protein YcaQ